MRLLLIRHAEIPTNVERRLETSVPGPSLTALGRQQAVALADRLVPEAITSVVRSPLTRTAQTIEPLLGRTGLAARVLDGLAEIEAGDLESRNDDEARDAYHGVMFEWVDGLLEPRIPGGPDGTEFLRRFDDAISDATSADDGTIAVVSHGAALRTWAAARCTNLDRRFVAQHPIPNTGVVEVRHDPAGAAWHCVTWLGRSPQEVSADITTA